MLDPLGRAPHTEGSRLWLCRLPEARGWAKPAVTASEDPRAGAREGPPPAEDSALLHVGTTCRQTPWGPGDMGSSRAALMWSVQKEIRKGKKPPYWASVPCIVKSRVGSGLSQKPVPSPCSSSGSHAVPGVSGRTSHKCLLPHEGIWKESSQLKLCFKCFFFFFLMCWKGPKKVKA